MQRIVFLFFVIALFSFIPATAAHVTLQDAFSPHDGASRLIEHTIDAAQKSVYVAAYTFTSKPIARTLAAAHDRGVIVKIVLDQNPYNARIAAYLRSHGIAVRISSQYKIMHDKFMIIDNETVELGSFNYTYSAEYDNAENVMIVHGAASIAADYKRQWDAIWAGAAG